MTTEEPGRAEESLLRELEDEKDAGIPLRERYGFVLLLVFLAYLMAGFERSRWVLVVNALIWSAVLLATLLSPGLPRALRHVGLAATLVVFVSTVFVGLVSESPVNGVSFIILSIAQLAALFGILNRIMRHEKVSIQTIMGGVAAYALIAFVMSSLYFGLDLLSESDFLNGVVNDGDYTYFSFVTLTTVGYGDITPASDLAKRLVVVEAFVGQVFIITFVARLVSLWGQPFRGGRG